MTGSRSPFTLLGIGMVALVVAAAVIEAAGTVTGAGLWLLVGALAVFTASALVYLLREPLERSAAIALFAVMGASLVLTYWVDPDGVALGLFLLGAIAPLRDPRRTIRWILVAVVLVFAVVQVLTGHETVLTSIAIAAGVVFFALLGILLLSERRRRDEVARLLVEVQEARAAERAASALAERSRIAREVHDVLAHSLSGLAIQLEAARLQANADGTDPALRSSVERALGLARDGLREAKAAVTALRGDATPGPDQLGTLVQEHRLATGSPTTLTVTGTPAALAPEAGIALYRTGQEALSNVRKHAPGARVDLTLAWTDDAITLTVVNELTRAPAQTSDGWGLTGMRERADSLGAIFTAGADDGYFTVRLHLPRQPLPPLDLSESSA